MHSFYSTLISILCGNFIMYREAISLLYRVLHVPMLKSSQLQLAVDFAYTGQCDLTLDNLQDVLEAADFLGMDDLIRGERFTF